MGACLFLFHEPCPHQLDGDGAAVYVLLDGAAEHNRISHAGRVGESVIAGSPRFVVHAVDVEGISLPVVDGDIAVGGVGDRHHGAADVVIPVGLGVVGQGASDLMDIGDGGIGDLGRLTSQTSRADVVGQQVAGVDSLLVAGDLGELVGAVGGGVGVHNNIISSVVIDLTADRATVVGVADEIVVVGGIDELLLEIRALDRAEDEGIVEGHDHLELGVGDLPRCQVVGASHRQEAAAQHNIVVGEGLLAYLGVEVSHQLAEVVPRAVAIVVAQHRVSRGDLILVLLHEGLHNGIVGESRVGGGGDQLGGSDLALAVGEVDGGLGVGDALVVAAALEVVDTLAVGEDVALVGVALEDDVHVALGEDGGVVGGQDGVADAARAPRAVAVMDGVDDEVCSRLPELLGFGLDQVGEVVPCFEVDAAGHLPRDGGVAVAHSPDDADAGAAALDEHRGLAVGDLLIGIAVIDVDGEEGEARQSGVILDPGLPPIVLVVAQSHGGEVQVVHPLGDDVALGEVGLRASLPHIPRREEEDVILVLIGVLEVGGQLIHARLGIGVAEFAVEVVDGEEIQHDDHRDAAIVALAVIVRVGMIVLGRQFGILGIQDALGGLVGSRGRLGIGGRAHRGVGGSVGIRIGIRVGGGGIRIGIGHVTALSGIGGDGGAHMGIHARRGDLGEDMGTGGEEDEESQKEGEKDFFHGGLRLMDFGRYLKMTERGSAVFAMTA